MPETEVHVRTHHPHSLMHFVSIHQRQVHAKKLRITISDLMRLTGYKCTTAKHTTHQLVTLHQNKRHAKMAKVDLRTVERRTGKVAKWHHLNISHTPTPTCLYDLRCERGQDITSFYNLMAGGHSTACHTIWSHFTPKRYCAYTIMHTNLSMYIYTHIPLPW